MRPTLLNKSIFRFIALLFAAIPVLGWGQGSVSFTSGTNACWTVPCGITSITVEVFGAGGEGGQGNSGGGIQYGGGGGGGGGYSVRTIVVTPGQPFRFSVGRGGGTYGGGGSNNGEPSSFRTANAACSADIAGVNMVANGGLGGVNASSGADGAGGAGGSASGGTTNTSGVIGFTGSNSGAFSYGGGGGNNGAGSNGASNNPTLDANGIDGGIGGGGSGGYGKVGSAAPGGKGGSGAIIISWSSISAGPNQTLVLCGTSTTMAASAAPAGYIGTWSVSPSGPTFSNINSPTSVVNGMTPGVFYTFSWTVAETGATPACTDSYDQMTVSTTAVVANAGPNQSTCQGTFTMSASVPPIGYTGTWTCTGCAGFGISITNINSPTTTVTGFNSALPIESVTLTWTVSGACSASDAVVISYPAVCNDDPCGAILLTPATTYSYTPAVISGATISQGMSEGGCVPQGVDYGIKPLYLQMGFYK